MFCTACYLLPPAFWEYNRWKRQRSASRGISNFESYPFTLPFIPGTETAGFVEAVGSDVSEFIVGDRVGLPREGEVSWKAR